jgi:hypothetical protein
VIFGGNIKERGWVAAKSLQAASNPDIRTSRPPGDKVDAWVQQTLVSSAATPRVEN